MSIRLVTPSYNEYVEETKVLAGKAKTYSEESFAYAEESKTSAEQAQGYASTALQAKEDTDEIKNETQVIKEQTQQLYDEFGNLCGTLDNESKVGKVTVLTDSVEANLTSFCCYGECTQGDNPTPSNLQEISVVTNPTVMVCGSKNLLPDSHNVAKATKTYSVKVFAGKYVLSVFNSDGTTTGITRGTTYVANLKDKNGDIVHASAHFAPTITEEEASRITQITVGWINTQYTGTSDKICVMLERNDHATDYEPYKPIQSVTLDGLTLAGIPNTDKTGWIVRDRVYTQNGRVYKEQNAQKYTFNGSEIICSADGFFYLPLANIKQCLNTGSALCSHYPWNYYAESASMYSVNNTLRFKNFASVYTDVATFRTWLANQNTNGTPFEILYPLATPIVTDITDTEAGQAVLSVLNMHTNDTTTTIISDANASISYKADTKKYIDNKIADITALVLEG